MSARTRRRELLGHNDALRAVCGASLGSIIVLSGSHSYGGDVLSRCVQCVLADRERVV